MRATAWLNRTAAGILSILLFCPHPAFALRQVGLEESRPANKAALLRDLTSPTTPPPPAAAGAEEAVAPQHPFYGSTQQRLDVVDELARAGIIAATPAQVRIYREPPIMTVTARKFQVGSYPSQVVRARHLWQPAAPGQLPKPGRGGTRWNVELGHELKPVWDAYLRAGPSRAAAQAMWNQLVRQEAIALCTDMTSKEAIAGLLDFRMALQALGMPDEYLAKLGIAGVGGGKSVVDSTHLDQNLQIVPNQETYSIEEEMRHARAAIRALLEAGAIDVDLDGTAPDLKTTQWMGWFADELFKWLADSRNTTPQARRFFVQHKVLAERLAELLWTVRPTTETPFYDAVVRYVEETHDPVRELGAITAKPGRGGSEGRPAATGRGLVILAKAIVRWQHPERADWPKPLKDVTVALDGYGNVAEPAARLFVEEEAIVEAVSDSTTVLYKPGGFTEHDLAWLSDHKGIEWGTQTKPQRGSFSALHPAALAERGISVISRAQLLRLPVTILGPCATQETITPADAAEILAKIILSGANGAFGPVAERIMTERGAIVPPDTLINAGGVIVSTFEIWQNLLGKHWPESMVNARLEKLLLWATARWLNRWQELQKVSPGITLAQAGDVLAVEEAVKAYPKVFGPAPTPKSPAAMPEPSAAGMEEAVASPVFDAWLQSYQQAAGALEAALDDGKIDRIWAARGRLHFAREELLMESTQVRPPRLQRGIVLYDTTDKRVFVYDGTDAFGDVHEKVRRGAIRQLQPLILRATVRAQRDQLVEQLFDLSEAARVEALGQLKRMEVSGLLPPPEPVADCFQHCHTPYSFSPYYPEFVLWRGYRLGLQVIGIVDHDTVAGFRSFRRAAEILGFPNATCGYEVRATPVDHPILMTQTINFPGVPGKMYIVVHAVDAETNVQTDAIRAAKIAGFQGIIDYINGLGLGGLYIDYERDIRPLTEENNPTERHLAHGIAEKIREMPEKTEIARKLIAQCRAVSGMPVEFTAEDRAVIDNPDQFLSVIRNKVIVPLRRLYPYTEDECPPLRDVVQFAHKRGWLGYYPYLGGGKGEAEGPENIDGLFGYLQAHRIDGIAFMPDRNTPDEIAMIQRLASDYGFRLTNGMDVNGPGMAFSNEYSDRRDLVQESLAIVHHEQELLRKGREAAGAEEARPAAAGVQEPIRVRVEPSAAPQPGRVLYHYTIEVPAVVLRAASHGVEQLNVDLAGADRQLDSVRDQRGVVFVDPDIVQKAPAQWDEMLRRHRLPGILVTRTVLDTMNQLTPAGLAVFLEAMQQHPGLMPITRIDIGDQELFIYV